MRARRPGGEKVIISVLQHRTYLRPARVNRKKEAARFYLSEPFHPERLLECASRAGKINFIICRCCAHARNSRRVVRATLHLRVTV